MAEAADPDDLDVIYRAVPGVEAVRLSDGAVGFRSDVVRCRLEGASATLVADRIWSRLEAWTTRASLVAALPDYAPASIRSVLDDLVEAGLVQRRPAAPTPLPSTPAESALAALGIDPLRAAERLSRVAVGVIGFEPVGRLVSAGLASAGVRRLWLAGPGAEDQASSIAASAHADGRAVDVLVGELSRAAVEAAGADLDLVVCAIDRGFLAARHWANRAALSHGRPVLYADAMLATALVGPLVLPGESACYMCYRMRHLATLDNFAEAFAYEQALDRRKRPDPDRPALPGVAEVAAGLALAEAFKLLFGPLIPGLVNAVAEFDMAEPKLVRHHVLQRPDCPHCAGIDKAVRLGR